MSATQKRLTLNVDFPKSHRRTYRRLVKHARKIGEPKAWVVRIALRDYFAKIDREAEDDS